MPTETAAPTDASALTITPALTGADRPRLELYRRWGDLCMPGGEPGRLHSTTRRRRTARPNASLMQIRAYSRTSC